MFPLARTVLVALSAGGVGPLLWGQTDPPDETVPDLVSWKMAQFTSEELRDGTSDDERILGSDGIPNLLRYALGLTAREATGPPLRMERIGDRLSVRVQGGLTLADVSLVLEASADLATWTPSPGLLSNASVQGQPEGSRVEAHEFPVDGPRFFRLRAERLSDDSDGDGLPDDLELAWFASVTPGPEDDPDQDGMSTADELSVGRSPHRGVISDRALATRMTGLEIHTPLE